MSIKYKEMVKSSTLSSSSANLYTAPAQTSASIQAATCYNTTLAPVLLTVFKVPANGAADTSNIICVRSVPAGSTVQAIEMINHKLEPGTSIYANGLGLTFNVSGVEYIQE